MVLRAFSLRFAVKHFHPDWDGRRSQQVLQLTRRKL